MSFASGVVYITMTTTLAQPTATFPASRLARRLVPLQLATFFQGMMLWVPVEKLFMTEIGFTPASMGLMAGVYAIAVPLLEIPSGLLADRWSRKGVLIAATLSLLAAVAVGAAATGVGVYLASAACLGVFIALQSGTADSIVYDTMLEEHDDTTRFDRQLGRLGMISSTTLVGSALIGGLVASAWTPRHAYLATLPFAALAVVCLSFIREPRLHRRPDSKAVGLRRQIHDTFSTVLTRPELRRVALAIALMALLVQMVIEFGPLWLVELRSSPAAYGPFAAAIFAALGAGSALASRTNLRRPGHRLIAMAGALGACATIMTARNTAAVTVAMAVLATVLVVARIQLTARLHDNTDSTVRAGVASSVSTVGFLMFLPLSIAFGAITEAFGVYRGAWLVTAVTIAALAAATTTFRATTEQEPQP